MGLTLREIGDLTRRHPQPPGIRLAALLAASRQRTTKRIAALQATLDRIDAYDRGHHGELTGQRPLWRDDAEAVTETA